MPGREAEIFENIEACEYVFLLVNPASGGNAAQMLLDTGFNYLHCSHIRDGAEVQVKAFVTDIRRGNSGHKDAFLILKGVVDAKASRPNDTNVRVVVAGGDGTAMWAISELLKHDISLERVIVGVIPLGTGNDFAHAMGSHIECKLPNESPLEMMRRLISEWLAMVPANFDLWKVTVSLHADGVVKKIDSKTRRKRVVEDETGLPVTRLEFSMLNYMSIGVESRIGLGFDRNRTKNPYLNRGAYVMEGLKKFLFHRTKFIDNMVSGLFLQRRPEEPYETVFRCRRLLSKTDRFKETLTGSSSIHTRRLSASGNLEIPRDPQSSSDSHCGTAPSIAMNDLHWSSDDSEDSLFPINEDRDAILQPCVSILFLNIPSFAGGLDPWSAAAGKLGVDLPREDTTVKREMEVIRSDECPQDYGDGHLEIIGFQSLMELSLSNLRRFMPNGPSGWRLYRAKGRLVLSFRERLEGAQRIYFQVDGEYFVGNRIRDIEIRRKTRVRVLTRPSKAPVQSRCPSPVIKKWSPFGSPRPSVVAQDGARVGSPMALVPRRSPLNVGVTASHVTQLLSEEALRHVIPTALELNPTV